MKVTQTTLNRLFNRVHIWNARKANPSLSIAALARLTQQPENRVRRAVKLLETAPKVMLQAFEHDAVDAWVRAVPIAAAKGDHRPAKDLLLHSRAIEPVQLQGQTQIAIVFAGACVPGLNASPSEGDKIIEIAKENAELAPSVQPVCQNDDPRGRDIGEGPRGGPG